MIKFSTLFVAIIILTACAKEQDTYFPPNNSGEKVFYAEYTQIYKTDTLPARHIVGQHNSEAILDTLSVPFLYILRDFDATSTLRQEDEYCSLTTTISQNENLEDDSYFGIGFKYNFPPYNCPPLITKELTDELFKPNKKFSIGDTIGQIEISKNRNQSYDYQGVSSSVAGISLDNDNTENFVKILSTSEYSWIKSEGSIEETIFGKLIEVEFNAKLRRTFQGDYIYPTEFIELKNGKGVFYIEYTD